MSKNPIRRSQLISPFGVGAMLVIQEGVGLLTAGLDHWYKSESGKKYISIDEYRVNEWRLTQRLGVEHFYLPPDYRDPQHESEAPNLGLTIPFHRFPRYHFCPECYCLFERPLSERSNPKCTQCINATLYQVPFVSICEAGHLQDFPWREWVHKQHKPICQKPLYLRATGSKSSLSGQLIVCECGAKRNLSQIMRAYSDGTTYLSKNLAEDGNIFLCPGHLTWLGEDEKETCQCHLRGSLRSASNVYFAQVYSSIYLPQKNSDIPDALIELISSPDISTYINLIGSLVDGDTEKTVQKLIDMPQYKYVFDNYSNALLIKAINFAEKQRDIQINVKPQNEDIIAQEETFRFEEYNTLQEESDAELLKIKETVIQDYRPDIANYFSGIRLVNKLRETRVMAGFSRVFASNINKETLLKQTSMLRKKSNTSNNWLPAYTVSGEGIFLTFDEEKLSNWENLPQIVLRIKRLNERYEIVKNRRKLIGQEITPRFVLLHTFSHILMNQLIFECGYSSAALKERLYVSTNPKSLMAGLLIYTADGDAEGTMGGLVRMGKHGYLEPVIMKALLNATWCSADPVCMEIGGTGGQGPDSCNGAACHNCALVPETACEQFNRFLDRATIVGDIDNPDIGYFKVR